MKKIFGLFCVQKSVMDCSAVSGHKDLEYFSPVAQASCDNCSITSEGGGLGVFA